MEGDEAEGEGVGRGGAWEDSADAGGLQTTMVTALPSPAVPHFIVPLRVRILSDKPETADGCN